MLDLTTIEIKAFVPAKNFEKSKMFYQDLGFIAAWSSAGLAYIQHGNTSFLLQEFRDGIDNFMMHLLVRDVDAWWSHVQDQGIVAKYGVMIEPVSDKPWGLRDFAISDPSGVLWRIGQNINTGRGLEERMDQKKPVEVYVTRTSGRVIFKTATAGANCPRVWNGSARGLSIQAVAASLSRSRSPAPQRFRSDRVGKR